MLRACRCAVAASRKDTALSRIGTKRLAAPGRADGRVAVLIDSVGRG